LQLERGGPVPAARRDESDRGASRADRAGRGEAGVLRPGDEIPGTAAAQPVGAVPEAYAARVRGECDQRRTGGPDAPRLYRRRAVRPDEGPVRRRAPAVW